MRMIDGGEGDDKVIAVPVKDPRWDDVQDIGDINKHTLKEIQHFFETYKQIEHKTVTVNGFKNKKAAMAAVVKSIKLYNKKFGK